MGHLDHGRGAQGDGRLMGCHSDGHDDTHDRVWLCGGPFVNWRRSRWCKFTDRWKKSDSRDVGEHHLGQAPILRPQRRSGGDHVKRLHKRRRYKAISFPGLEIPWAVGASGVRDLDGAKKPFFREWTYRRSRIEGESGQLDKKLRGIFLYCLLGLKKIIYPVYFYVWVWGLTYSSWCWRWCCR